MEEIDTREVNRDSLFLLAQVRVAGESGAARVKVRNLSDGGMMAEGPVEVVRGTAVEVDLRNIGWVSGMVAWTQGDRFGISFAQPIDPAMARDSMASSHKANENLVLRQNPPSQPKGSIRSI